jgi:predicted lysophospholipase L1 biosynthesis ABC-type transport system permease subunit
MAQGTRNTPDMEIIGVFSNARYEDVRGGIPRQVFVALDARIRNISGVNVLAHIQGDPRRVTPQLREQPRRIALGADKGRVIRLVMMETLPMILSGIVAGMIAGLVCGRFVENQLFGVKAANPLVFVLSVAVLLTASMLAACIPAWRASRIEPMASLRHE